MLRMHRAVILLIPFAILVPETIAADKQQYLLNCRLIDRSNPVYQQYCTGQSGQERRVLLCQLSTCRLVVTNFNLQSSPALRGAASSATINTGASTNTGVSSGGIAGTARVSGTVSGAVATAGSVAGRVGSGLTGAVSKAVGGLGL
jgi:hypothetical protein